ncbi:MAG: hypothetical protein PHD48_02685 [Alphaproteobacteria bacterium]|nr:hypothetical protein [Alphaproteobacteria bacterium]
MKSLETLIKLQKTRVDEQRLIFAKMQEQLSIVLNQIDALALEQEQQRQLLHEHPSFALTYGEYVKRALMQKEGLERKRRAAELAVKLAHEKLTEVFEEQKRYEIAQQNRIDEAEREELRRETLTLDEVGSISFIRKKKI